MAKLSPGLGNYMGSIDGYAHERAAVTRYITGLLDQRKSQGLYSMPAEDDYLTKMKRGDIQSIDTKFGAASSIYSERLRISKNDVYDLGNKMRFDGYDVSKLNNSSFYQTKNIYQPQKQDPVSYLGKKSFAYL